MSATSSAAQTVRDIIEANCHLVLATAHATLPTVSPRQPKPHPLVEVDRRPARMQDHPFSTRYHRRLHEAQVA